MFGYMNYLIICKWNLCWTPVDQIVPGGASSPLPLVGRDRRPRNLLAIVPSASAVCGALTLLTSRGLGARCVCWNDALCCTSCRVPAQAPRASTPRTALTTVTTRGSLPPPACSRAATPTAGARHSSVPCRSSSPQFAGASSSVPPKSWALRGGTISLISCTRRALVDYPPVKPRLFERPVFLREIKKRNPPIESSQAPCVQSACFTPRFLCCRPGQRHGEGLRQQDHLELRLVQRQ